MSEAFSVYDLLKLNTPKPLGEEILEVLPRPFDPALPKSPEVMDYAVIHYTNVVTKLLTEEHNPVQHPSEYPIIPGPEVRQFLAALVFEEVVNELLPALGFRVKENLGNLSLEMVPMTEASPEPNMEKIVDGVCDSIFVIEGVMVACGLPTQLFMNEVCRANLDKFKDGVKINEAGKYQKPEGWEPPDHLYIFKELSKAYLQHNMNRVVHSIVGLGLKFLDRTTKLIALMGKASKDIEQATNLNNAIKLFSDFKLKEKEVNESIGRAKAEDEIDGGIPSSDREGTTGSTMPEYPETSPRDGTEGNSGSNVVERDEV